MFHFQMPMEGLFSLCALIIDSVLSEEMCKQFVAM